MDFNGSLRPSETEFNLNLEELKQLKNSKLKQTLNRLVREKTLKELVKKRKKSFKNKTYKTHSIRNAEVFQGCWI